MKLWYALRSKPKREAFAASLLARAGLEMYVPEVKVRGRAGRPPAAEPFFPGYLFGRLDAEAGEIRLASYTSGILYVVGYAGEPWPVPDGIVGAIQQRLAQGPARVMLPDVKTGDRLVVTNGPFKDLEAIFERHLSSSGRVQVFIQMLNRVCRAELNVAQLRKAGQAA